MNEALKRSLYERLNKIVLDIMRHNNQQYAKFEIAVDARRRKVSGKMITTDQRYEGGSLVTVIREDPF